MPVYEPNEHEILKEETKQIKEGVQISEGMLYLTDRRFIYELKGKRGFLRASAPVTMIDIRLDAIMNVSTAVPRFKLMTKKTLTLDYKTDKGEEHANFIVDDPVKWDRTIREWISDSKRFKEEQERREKEEAYKKEVELAKAKSPKANIGNVYMGDRKKQMQPTDDEYVDAEYEESGETDLQVSEKEYPAKASSKCKKCGTSVDAGMKFCPNCGNPL